MKAGSRQDWLRGLKNWIKWSNNTDGVLMFELLF